MNVAINGDLGTDKRIRGKIERVTRLVREAGSKDYDSEQSPDSRQGLRDMASNDPRTPQQVRQIAEERIAQDTQAREETERQLRIIRTRAEEAETEARELGSQWVVQREEIQFTNEELGRGGWGVVKVANFRGT